MRIGTSNVADYAEIPSYERKWIVAASRQRHLFLKLWASSDPRSGMHWEPIAVSLADVSVGGDDASRPGTPATSGHPASDAGEGGGAAVSGLSPEDGADDCARVVSANSDLPVVSAHAVTCPMCGDGSDSLEDFAVWFCPSVPDKCLGCEMYKDRRQCPACEHEWETDPQAV